MRYIVKDEKMIMVDTRVNFKGLLKKIYYHLKINWRRSNVWIYIDNDLVVLGNPYELKNDEDIEFLIMAVRKKSIDTSLFYKESNRRKRQSRWRVSWGRTITGWSDIQLGIITKCLRRLGTE